MIRRAPVTGYKFFEKQLYRRKVWKLARQAVNPKASHVLLMPSAEGIEIEIARRNGFRCDLMHVVDSNPAIVAHLKRRYPWINTYGVSVDRALSKIEDSGVKLSFANFDLTCTCQQIEEQVGSHRGAFKDTYCVAVSMQRGREDSWELHRRWFSEETLRWIKLIKPTPDESDALRLYWTFFAISNRQRSIPLLRSFYWEKYKSNAVTMLWVFTKINKRDSGEEGSFLTSEQCSLLAEYRRFSRQERSIEKQITEQNIIIHEQRANVLADLVADGATPQEAEEALAQWYKNQFGEVKNGR